MNPSLQNPYMIAHPPMLYLGYVGLTVPFAFAMAALASRRVDERWIVVTRRWTLAAWTFLGFGVLLGAKWAYEEVGWGGWYAGPGRERRAHALARRHGLPALRDGAGEEGHAAGLERHPRRGRLRSFALRDLLTRSGVISSIHSFTQSSIGPFFLGFIAVVAAFSIALIITRSPQLRSKTRMESLVSREAAFLYNNLFLVALALTILWGVIYPLVSEAARGVAVSVGAPYYDFFAIVFGLPLVLLMGIGPVVAWRRASLRSLARQLAWPTGVALAVGVLLLAGGAGSSPAGLIGYTLGAFVLDDRARVRPGHESAEVDRNRRLVAAFSGLVARNRRRYGGYVVHASIVLLLVGAVGIGGFSSSREVRLDRGEAAEVGDYRVVYTGSSEQRGANAQEVRAHLDVFRDGEHVGTMEAGKNSYFAEEQTSNEVGIRTDWLRGEDLFVIADRFFADGSVQLEVIVNPLVNLIWLAGLVFVLGAAVAMWPDAREQRRLAQRFAGEGALARA